MNAYQKEKQRDGNLLNQEQLDSQIYQDRESNWRETLLPAYLNLLDQIEVEVSEDNATYETLTYDQLSAAQDKGTGELQKIKVDHISQLVSIRFARGIGTAFKVSIQYLLQSEGLGDRSTFIADPVDQKSSRAIGEFLLNKMNRDHLWGGFGKIGDFCDPLSVHKNEKPPLLGHDPDPYNGRSTPINNMEDLDYYLEIARRIVKDERIRKVAIKLAKAENPDFEGALLSIQGDLIKNQIEAATILMDKVYSGAMKWRELNVYLKMINQGPLEKYDHSLIKIFAQDMQEGKMGQVLLDKHALTLEFSPNQFTPRGHENSKEKIRISIAIAPSGRPVIIGEKAHLPYLYPLLNSKDFFRRLDKALVDRIKSPYYDIQLMMKLGMPVSQITESNFQKAMEKGEIAFVADAIAGIHKTNTRDRNGDHPHFLPYLEGLNIDNLESHLISPEKYTSIIDGTYISELHKLISKCVSQPNKLEERDQTSAKRLLEVESELLQCYHLPPSTFTTLKEIVRYGQSRRVPYRTLILLEQQVV